MKKKLSCIMKYSLIGIPSIWLLAMMIKGGIQDYNKSLGPTIEPPRVICDRAGESCVEPLSDIR